MLSCRHGKYNLCEKLKVMGFQTTGTASEYFAVEESKVTALPDEMDYNDGAMIEPLAVTVHAAKHYEHLEGANVAVLGCGPIGILLAQTCKALGAAKVMSQTYRLPSGSGQEMRRGLCYQYQECGLWRCNGRAFRPGQGRCYL